MLGTHVESETRYACFLLLDLPLLNFSPMAAVEATSTLPLLRLSG